VQIILIYKETSNLFYFLMNIIFVHGNLEKAIGIRNGFALAIVADIFCYIPILKLLEAMKD
jgi:hypothetical protein